MIWINSPTFERFSKIRQSKDFFNRVKVFLNVEDNSSVIVFGVTSYYLPRPLIIYINTHMLLMSLTTVRYLKHL